MNNWWGVECHPSDSLISWQDLNRSDFYQTAGDVREAWDKIVAAGLTKELKLLLERSREVALDEAAELNAGADI